MAAAKTKRTKQKKERRRHKQAMRDWKKERSDHDRGGPHVPKSLSGQVTKGAKQ